MQTYIFISKTPRDVAFTYTFYAISPHWRDYEVSLYGASYSGQKHIADGACHYRPHQVAPGAGKGEGLVGSCIYMP